MLSLEIVEIDSSLSWKTNSIHKRLKKTRGPDMSLSENIKKAEGYLARFKNDGVKNHINGKDVASAETFITISPIDLKQLANVGRGNGRGY